MKNEVGGEERFRKEKAKGRKLRQSQWWKEKVSKGICHYCAGEFTPVSLTMDHKVPIARGGKSTKGNVVPSCKKCNTTKNTTLLPKLSYVTKWAQILSSEFN